MNGYLRCVGGVYNGRCLPWGGRRSVVAPVSIGFSGGPIDNPSKLPDFKYQTYVVRSIRDRNYLVLDGLTPEEAEALL